MSYQDVVTEKRQMTAQSQKEKSELKAMLDELKKMQMATLMGSQGKSTVILTDQTDLGDKIKELTEKLTAAVKSTDVTDLNQHQLYELKGLQESLEELTKKVEANKPDNNAIISAIKSLKLIAEAPIINLPQPKVTVQERPVDFSGIDFSPITDALKVKTDYSIDLSRYRACDSKDSGDNIQYVGFVNPEGHWYIIENKVKENSMRYLFGMSAYSKHFKSAPQYQYKLLDKAINAAA